MTTVNPATGQALPDSAIQRVLFTTHPVHVYGIPPITSTQGFSASSWTAPPRPTAQQIFTARLRIIETSIDNNIQTDVVLEDASTGDLFAAAPYTSPAVVQQANDSSRFFAVRVVGEGGRKATLGIGFEDRSPAFDFGVALGEARKVLGMEGRTTAKKETAVDVKKDFSLKEGQTINVQVGSKGRRHAPTQHGSGSGRRDENAALFSIAPPPASGKPSDVLPDVAPPSSTTGKSAQELGFDDGEFGEFQ